MKLIKNVLIIANSKKENVHPILSLLISDLDRRGIRHVELSPVYIQLDNGNIISDIDVNYHYRDYDLIIAIGGDGTFLYTARNFSDLSLPIAGINAGRIGFLMASNPDEITAVIDNIINEKISIEEKLLLEARVIREDHEVYFFRFLNDAVIAHTKILRMIELTVSINDEILSRYRADGIIISTPTGSTAYNLAAGGPILNPGLEAMVITPICPHVLGVRPIVCSLLKPLTIELISSEADAALTIDGQENVTLKQYDKIKIVSSGKNIKTYDNSERQFINVLREKLGWHK